MTDTENGGAALSSPADMQDLHMRWDRANKTLFSVRESVLDLLYGYVLDRLRNGHDWFSRYDTGAMRPGPTEIVLPNLRLSSGDIRWMVPLRGAPAGDPRNWLELIIALEFQQTIDWHMARRMRFYADLHYYTTWDGQRARKTDRLPAVLPIVLYGGEQEWTAPTSCEALVDPRLVPSDMPEPPMSFTGGSYIVIDLLALLGTELTERNVVSLMIRTLGMTDPDQATKILEDSLVLPQASGSPFLPWFGVATKSSGLEIGKELEDWAIMQQLMREGKIRPSIQTMFRQRDNKLRQEVRTEVFRNMAEHKFGSKTAMRLAGILDGVDDQNRLDIVANLIIDCDDGDDLIARLDSLIRTPA